MATGFEIFGAIANAATVLAVIFAGYEVQQSVLQRRSDANQRRQELRFMYAQRAVGLDDALRGCRKVMDELDERLTAHFDYTEELFDRIAGLRLENFLHEAQIVSALAKGAKIEGSQQLMVEYIESLQTIKSAHAELARSSAMNPFGRFKPMRLGEAQQEHMRIARELGTDKPFAELLQQQLQSIEAAYVIQYNAAC